jgi:hypothetical protein
MHSQQRGPQSATLLRIRALPVRATGCAYGCHLLRALRIGKMGICVHSTLLLQAHIGMKPDAASGRCVKLRLCPTRLPRGHRKITRSNTKATSVLVSFFLFRPHRGVSGKHRSRLVPLEANSVRACPRRTKPAPIYSAQIPPSVKKRPQLGWELRDQAPGVREILDPTPLLGPKP